MRTVRGFRLARWAVIAIAALSAGCASITPTAKPVPAGSPAVSVPSPGTVPRPPRPSPSGGSTSTAMAPLSWSLLESPAVTDGFAGRLSCPSVSFCAAAAWLGRSGQPAELGLTVFDGTSWAAPTAEASFGRPAGPGLPDAAVSCSSTSFCLAVSGSAWSAPAGLPTGPASGRSALSCASPALCLLADGSQNGTTGASMTKYAVWGGERWSTP